MKSIEIEESIGKDYNYLDTRSPSEFSIDHVPGAFNIPIFDDSQRKEIGILYKADKQKAFDLGIQYYSKKLPLLVEEIRKLPRNKPLIIYCWRGGMRSKAVTQLADLLGYRAFQLKGGYKAYRNFTRENLYNYTPGFRFIVLWGMTGTAKTRMIRQLSPSLDLEGLAQHRSSLFGAIGLEPRSQKYFESLFYFELLRLEKENFVFTEGESKKIGEVTIPKSVYKHIEKGINVKVNCSLKKRVQNTVEEYFSEGNISQIKSIIPFLKQKLGKKRIGDLLDYMNKGQYENVAEILLTEYYDPLYKHTIDNIDYDYTIDGDDIKQAIKQLNDIYNKLGQKKQKIDCGI